MTDDDIAATKERGCSRIRVTLVEEGRVRYSAAVTVTLPRARLQDAADALDILRRDLLADLGKHR